MNLKKVAKYIQRRVQDDSLAVGISMMKCRRRGIGHNELNNVEFMEELVDESNSDEMYLVSEDGGDDDSCRVEDGRLIFCAGGDRYEFPVEDIEGIRIRRDKSVAYIIELIGQEVTINFLSQKNIDYWQNELKKWLT